MQLCAFSEGVAVLCDTTYQNEGSGQEVFYIGDVLDKIMTSHPNGVCNMDFLPKTMELIKGVVTKFKSYSESARSRLDNRKVRKKKFEAKSRSQITATIQKKYPKKKSKINRNSEIKFKDLSKEEQDAIVKQATTSLKVDYETELAIENHALDQVKVQGVTEVELIQMVRRGLNPIYSYLHKHMSKDGDRYEMLMLFRSARILDPEFAA